MRRVCSAQRTECSDEQTDPYCIGSLSINIHLPLVQFRTVTGLEDVEDRHRDESPDELRECREQIEDA